MKDDIRYIYLTSSTPQRVACTAISGGVYISTAYGSTFSKDSRSRNPSREANFDPPKAIFSRRSSRNLHPDTDGMGSSSEPDSKEISRFGSRNQNASGGSPHLHLSSSHHSLSRRQIYAIRACALVAPVFVSLSRNRSFSSRPNGQSTRIRLCESRAVRERSVRLAHSSRSQQGIFRKNRDNLTLSSLTARRELCY
jgi:hypothetical protein